LHLGKDRAGREGERGSGTEQEKPQEKEKKNEGQKEKEENRQTNRQTKFGQLAVQASAFLQSFFQSRNTRNLRTCGEQTKENHEKIFFVKRRESKEKKNEPMWKCISCKQSNMSSFFNVSITGRTHETQRRK
jgi:hypothetical protein